MNKKIMIGTITCVVLLAAIGMYFMNTKKGNDFIDFSEGIEKTCVIRDNEPNLLVAYTGSKNTYVGTLNMDELTISSTCELPFENNENIYIEQDMNGALFISNGIDELFKYNGSHFLKIPFQAYTVGTDVRVSVNDKYTVLNIHAGSVDFDKEFTYTSGYTVKNAYAYSNVVDLNTLNLYGDSDPGIPVSDSFIVMRVHVNESVYYAFFDTATKELRRMISNPFEVSTGAFYATIENDKPLLFVGGQVFDVNDNNMIAHDAQPIEESNVSVEAKAYSNDSTVMATYIKSTDGESYPYVIQSKYAIDYAYIVYK